MGNRQRIAPSSAPHGDAAAFRKAGGRAAWKPGEGGAAQDVPGTGKGWGGGIVFKQADQSPPPVVVDRDDPARTAKVKLHPARRLREVIASTSTQSSSSSASNGTPAPHEPSAASTTAAPTPLPTHSVHSAPPPPSFADQAHLRGPELMNHHHAPVASTSVAPAPPAGGVIRAEPSKATNPHPASKKAEQSPPESPWLTYEPDKPADVVRPGENFAQGRSEFGAARRGAAPKPNPRGYESAVPPAPAANAASSSPPGARKPVTWGTARAARLAAAGKGSASAPVSNETHTSKWATPAPVAASAPPNQPTARTTSRADLPRGVQAAMKSNGALPPQQAGTSRPPAAAPVAAQPSTSTSRYAARPSASRYAPLAPTTHAAARSTLASAAPAPAPAPAPVPAASRPAAITPAPAAAPQPALQAAQQAPVPTTATDNGMKEPDIALPAWDVPAQSPRVSAALQQTGEIERKLIALKGRKEAVASQRAELDARSPRREVWRRQDEGRARERDARLASGGGRKEKKSPEELDALMAKMRAMNLEVRSKMEAAEQDRAHFEAERDSRRSAEVEALAAAERERVQALSEAERAEREKKARTAEIQRQIDAERARSAARKLAHASGRAWDAGKLDADPASPSRIPAPAPAVAYPSIEAAARDRAREAEAAARAREPVLVVSDEEAERIRRRDGVRAAEGGWETVVHQEERGRAQLVVHE